jgi:hypothetical protein
MSTVTHHSAKTGFQFQHTPVADVFNSEKIKDVVRKEIDSLQTTLLRLVDQLAEAYQAEEEWIRAAMADPVAFKLDHRVFNIQIAPETAGVTLVTQKNQADVLQSAAYVSDKLTRDIWLEFDRVLQRHILNETVAFSVFVFGCFPHHVDLFENLRGKNRRLIVDLVAQDARLDPHLTLDGYFESLKQRMVFPHHRFSLTESFGVDQAVLNTFETTLTQTLSASTLIRHDFELQMAAELELQGHGSWEVRLECGQMSHRLPIHKRYVRFEKNGYSLCAFS